MILSIFASSIETHYFHLTFLIATQLSFCLLVQELIFYFNYSFILFGFFLIKPKVNHFYGLNLILNPLYNYKYYFNFIVH